MLEDITHIDIDEFLSIVMNTYILSLHTRIQESDIICRDLVVEGGDRLKTIAAIRDAKPGTNLCLTYQNDQQSCRHLTFIKVDDTDIFVCEDKIGYTFASGQIISKIFKERPDSM